MHRLTRPIVGALLALLSLGALAACGSSSKSSSSSSSSPGPAASSGSAGGQSITYLMGTAPDYLDPQLTYTTQGAEPTYVSYTPLLAYAHADGAGATQLIPGLATALPVITDGGKTYTLTMRSGLKYSNGAPVKASDFKYALERALKLNWGGASYFIGNIVGATAYQSGKAKTISGITTDDATGKITIHLPAPYGAFPNLLAFEAAAPVPAGTAMSNLSNSPPPGVGPYEITNVVPNQGWTMKINPNYAAEAIPGIPAAHVNINVKIESNTQTEAEDIIQNSADVFDPGDTLPPSLQAQIQGQDASRFKREPVTQNFYFFLNTATKPFSNKLAREAVVVGLDRPALSRLDSGNLIPACYFLPAGLPGHPTAPCPYGNPGSTGDLAKAKALVQQSGMAGQPVTVYGETRSPRKEYVDYYTSFLNQIGFKATEKILADANYFPTVGNLKLDPQTGFADWNQDFPNPVDFYLLLDSKGIQATNNQNFSQVKDPRIDSAVNSLGVVPANKLSSVAGRWAALDQYAAQQAYEAVYGYQTWPVFTSTRVNFSALRFIPLYGLDWSSIALK